MSHRDYSNAGFTSPRKQHNVIAFVGNGFDLQVMHDYGQEITTRYESFYHFLKLRSFDESNPILQEIEKLRGDGKKNWSDIEHVVSDMLATKQADPARLAQALQEMQKYFSEFLDLAVPSSLLSELGADSMERGLAVESLSKFLGDLDDEEYEQLEFPRRVDNFDVYNFVFINFNYTPLLDDFVYLDQKQFDPLPHSGVDRNFDFHRNPRDVDVFKHGLKDPFSSYLMSEVVHPHGHMSVPRSLLFGTDIPAGEVRNQDPALRLAKPFWAQTEQRHSHLFEDTELFIVFGCSLGESDRWWWKRIASVLGRSRDRTVGSSSFVPELVVYWYNGGDHPMTKDQVRERFVSAAGYTDEFDIEPFIRVVLHNASTERTWLNTSRPEDPDADSDTAPGPDPV